MAIIKIKKRTSPYVTIDCTALKDPNLSAKAKGVFCYLLCMPPNWKIYLSELTNHFKDGGTSISSAVKELELAGYISKQRINGEGGRFEGVEYNVYETPELAKQALPINGKPINGKQVTTNTTTSVVDTNKTKTKRKAQPDSVEICILYFGELKSNGNEALSFYDYYASKGWKVGQSPMKDWQAAARNWVRRSKQFATKGVANSSTHPNEYNSKYEWSIRGDQRKTNEYHKHLREIGWKSKYSPAGGVQWLEPKV
tara:strand:+ start:2187 stop:2951 length:765 start_codon:yes stop_codon:yes gene_type:complete